MSVQGAAPRSPFGKRSTAEEVTAGLDLSGKTALVTGCTSGIGFETMRVLALRGARVFAVGRTADKMAACAAGLSPALRARITPLGCELGELASVAACADAVKGFNLPLDIVVCNAGIIGLLERQEIEGIEKHFVVNHLSHFVLVNRLMGRIVAAPQGRVVVLSSDAHRSAPATGIAFDDLSWANDYRPMRAYGHSKLANHLFTRALSRRLANTSVTVNSVHPGVVATHIFHRLPLIARIGIGTVGRLFMKGVPAGAATQCYVATAPALHKASGLYFSDCNPATVRGAMVDDAMALRLWTVSEDLSRPYLN